MGKALYRRYRPKTLSEVVGQDQVTRILERAIRSGKIAHAYLFVGPRGTGKTSVARILAHEINGFKYELEDDYLDIVEIDAATNTGVDNIRDLREKVMIAPSVGKYKIYIIDEIHMLTKAAFNALLKTLEEPPEHVVFIMATTDVQKVPITIKSRSQIYNFKLADSNVMVEHLRKVSDLEKIPIDDAALRIIAKRSGGSFRDAMSLLDQVSTLEEKKIDEGLLNKVFGLPEETLLLSLLGAYKDGDIDLLRSQLKELLDKGIKPETIANELIVKIVEDFDGVFLPLLSGLTEVGRSAYPEVKLLLTLIGPIGVRVEKQDRIVTPKTGKLSESQPVGGDDVVSSCAPGQDSVDGKGSRDNLDLSDMSQIKQSLLNDADLAGLRHYLEEADIEVNGKKLQIFTKKSFARDQIAKKRDKILALLPDDYEVEVLNGAKAVDETIANIAALMGGGEEVALND